MSSNPKAYRRRKASMNRPRPIVPPTHRNSHVGSQLGAVVLGGPGPAEYLDHDFIAIITHYMSLHNSQLHAPVL